MELLEVVVMRIVSSFANIIELCAAFIIVSAGIRAFLGYIFKALFQKMPKEKLAEQRLRIELGFALSLALEFELGADILKVPYPGDKPEDKDRFAEICANSHVPVVMLGGSKKDSTLEILKVAQNGVEAGAKGTIFGRNVWQRPQEEMTRVVQALQDIVHRGVSAADAAGKYGITQ